MMRKSLVAAVAVAPLLAALAATSTRAETQISTSTTTPVATATVKNGGPDDITIVAGGQVAPTTAGPAVTLNSSNVVKNQGVITIKDVDNATGILIDASKDITGSVTNSGGITINETNTVVDVNKNSVDDEPWAKGTGRFGIRLTGPGSLKGDITNAAGGSITIQGNDSAGISIESGLTGSLIDQGAISVTGDRAKGISVTKSGSITGDLAIGSTISASGAGASGVDVQGTVGGSVHISGSIGTTGYRVTNRTGLSADVLKALVAAELQQGGPAVSVGASVGTGILITAAAPSGTKSDDKTTDADKDGVIDSTQTAGAITSLGSGPALRIGSSDQGTGVVLGAPSAGDFAFGLINNGTITGSGIFDQVASPNLPAPVSATAVEIGVAGGGAVTIAGGFRNTGTVQAGAVGADSTAVHLNSGATVPAIVNTGAITSVSTTTGQNNAGAIIIESGAAVTSIANTGTISANIQGSLGDANAIIDKGGAVTTITNTGAISATVTQTDTKIDVLGVGTAIDVSAAKSGVTITQTKSTATGATDPVIIGAIRLGDGADLLDIEAGSLTGDMSFGDGEDTFKLAGGATAKGAVTDTDGKLTLNIDKGSLTVTNVQAAGTTQQVTAVNVSKDGTLLVAADPLANDTNDDSKNVNTHFSATSKSTFADGATLGVTLQSLQTRQSTKYTILEVTDPALLSTGVFAAGALANAPFLYNAVASADATHVYITVEKKTASELGFSATEAAAYDAIFSALLKDKQIQTALLNQTTQGSLQAVYDQLLPDQGLGVFEALDAASQSISSLTGTTPDAGVRVAGTSLWLQEVNERVNHDSGTTLGSSSRLFGLTGGYEHMGSGGGALGVSLSYLNVQENDKAAAVGEHVVASILEGGVYYRRAIGGLRFSVRGAGGYAWFSGDRLFVSPGVQRHSEARWGGAFADAHAGLGYELHLGRFYARPEVSADFLYLKENGRTETGGGDGFNLTVAPRSSSRGSAQAIMVIGGQWGRDTWLRPEIRGGYRQIFAGNIGDTVASFTGGNPFTLPTTDDKGGWFTVGFSIKGGTSLSYVAVEGDADFRSGDQRYDIRLAGRSMF